MTYSYTGRRLIADILEDITGLTEWVDYFPVQYDETTDTATKGGALIITDEGGPGDNHPVFLVTGRTNPFRCNDTGYVPIIDAPIPPGPTTVFPVMLASLPTYDGIASPNATSHTALIPAVETGDLVVLIVASGASRVVNDISGWTRYQSTKAWQGSSTWINRATVYWKIASADAAASTQAITFSGSTTAQIVALRIQKDTFDPYTPFVTSPKETVTQTLTAAAFITPPTVTVGWGAEKNLWIPYGVFQKAALNGNLKVDEVVDEVSYQPSSSGTSLFGIGLYEADSEAASYAPFNFVAYNDVTPTDTIMFSDVIAVKPKIGEPVAPDAIPEIEVRETNNTLTAATSVISYPAAVAAGDLLICVFEQFTTRTLTVPAGWTSLGTTAYNATTKHHIFYKVAAGTEGGTTFTAQQSGTGFRHAVVIKVEAAVFDNSGTFIEKPTGTTGFGRSMTPPVCAPSWGVGSRTLFIPLMSLYRFVDEVRAFPYYNYARDYQITGISGSSAPCLAVDTYAATTASESPDDFLLVVGADRGWNCDVLMIKLA